MILFELLHIKNVQDTKSSLCSGLIFGRLILSYLLSVWRNAMPRQLDFNLTRALWPAQL